MKMPDNNTVSEFANDVADMRFADLREMAERRRAELVAQYVDKMKKTAIGDLVAELMHDDIEFVNCIKWHAVNFRISRLGQLLMHRADFIYGDECVEQEAERLQEERCKPPGND